MKISRDFPDEIDKLEEASNNYISENDPKIFKIEFRDKWKYISWKLAHPHYFNSLDDYQKQVNNIKKTSSVN